VPEGLSTAGALRLWSRLPAIVRGLVAGYLVSSVGGLVPAVFMLANLKLFPAVPWLLPATAVWLWLFWRYAGGAGWPRATARARRRDLRGRALPRRAWAWALAAGCPALLACVAMAFLTPRFSYIPRDAFKLPIDFSAYPSWTVVSILLAISATAGVVEEAGYRGYMLAPIQRRHGWVVGIVVVGSMFFLDHYFSHDYATFAFLPFFLTVSAVHGLLVFFTRSILPSVVLHGVLDFTFIPIQYGIVGNPATDPIWQTGVDRWFVGCLAVMVIFGAAAVPAFRRLAAVARDLRLADEPDEADEPAPAV
jgi:membrane protease YdiL (CAAX protease family)